MFKKLKDKLAEEVKSSPQRIQQFAQAAQAAVTSASSSISDITNNDLFTIGDNDNNHRSPESASKKQNMFHEISLVGQQSSQDSSYVQDTSLQYDETTRQRRLSNSSFSSDISFRLPTYESPSMYHVQSDMDISASEAEEKGFGGTTVNLDRVTKEDLYFAYRRTRDRCSKYKSQYADLARHYKLLERENSKARNVLVETQDKALRRISELKEQCTLEQSAKAHLEKTLRVELEEKNLKIDTLNTKVNFLQENKDNDITFESVASYKNESDNEQLIDLKTNDSPENAKEESVLLEITSLNNKVVKMEQLINKYKESLKVSKEKNAQVITELQLLSTELENKNKEIDLLKSTNANLANAEQKVIELNDDIEKLQSAHTVLEFSKNKEVSVLKLDLEQAHEEIFQLNKKIVGLSKREEEYAISLAENKLSIHKELESKEAEIKSLKDSLSTSQNEVQSLKIVVSDYKKNISLLEEEQTKLKENANELNIAKAKLNEHVKHVEELTKKIQFIEHSKAKLDEEYKCLELQCNQETAEKLAIQDRNVYLENRNLQLSEDCSKKSLQINNLESELKSFTKNENNASSSRYETENKKLTDEVKEWKTKYLNLESEIQEERDELVKLQKNIEQLLSNHESVQSENAKLLMQVAELEKRNNTLYEQNQKTSLLCVTVLNLVKALQQNINNTKKETLVLLHDISNEIKQTVKEKFHNIMSSIAKSGDENEVALKSTISSLQNDLKNIVVAHEKAKEELLIQIKQNKQLQIELQQEKTNFEKTKTVLKNNSEERYNILEELSNLRNENQDVCQKIKCLQEANEKLKEKNQHFEEDYNKISKDYEELLHKFKLYEDSKVSVEKENLYLTNKNKELENILNDTQDNMCKMKKENENFVTEIKHFETFNIEMESAQQNLIEKIKEMETYKSEKESELRLLQETIMEIQKDLVVIKTENQTLQDLLEESKLNNSKSKIENTELNCKLIELMEQKSALLAENETTLIDLNKIKDSNVYLQDKVNILKKQNENDALVLEALRQENIELKKKVENYNECIVYSQELEENVKALKSENVDITSKSEAISANVMQLEMEMIQIRNSHIEIEKEKDQLNSIIKNLENNELNFKSSNTFHDAYSQTSDYNFEDDGLENFQFHENLGNKSEGNENVELKEENRRLKSDIEGLQNYLAKISKENSDLNEKLRAVISSNDNFSEHNETSQYDILALRSEIQSGKDKIDNLTRENTLLAEENLELKDQIHDQGSDGKKEIDFSKNYNSMLETKKNLEKRVNELEHTNWSINMNMQEIQDNNEKLRMSNEKLGRRLDEALVSLRHLHSLQENTELEYLRNILYEYLTGSGTHSLTLAKVLSAVVKFNDAQTELVLQKEKERQGILRQLGIII